MNIVDNINIHKLKWIGLLGIESTQSSNIVIVSSIAQDISNNSLSYITFVLYQANINEAKLGFTDNFPALEKVEIQEQPENIIFFSLEGGGISYKYRYLNLFAEPIGNEI